MSGRRRDPEPQNWLRIDDLGGAAISLSPDRDALDSSYHQLGVHEIGGGTEVAALAATFPGVVATRSTSG
jgi:hypothetical protein